MKYKISHEKPESFFKTLREKFGESADWDKGTVIAVGDTIYAKDDMPQSLIVHEVTHLEQQKKIGVEKWWNQYLNDGKFRLDQELEAYRAQAQHIKNDPKTSRQVYRSTVSWLAKGLSGSMYGNIISYEEALRLIKI